MRAYQSVSKVAFPKPEGHNVNMMPFVIGDKSSIPVSLHTYWPLIEACDVEPAEHGKVGYLTVSESTVTAGTSQRRGGVHCERHPRLPWGGGGWGGGRNAGHHRFGGLYLASNLKATTRVWENEVAEPGPGGNCEHLLDQLGAARDLEENELVWMTDRCPHAALPQRQAGNRQFFRLVTSEVSLWYVDHSTANPLGVTPPSTVKLLHGSKF